ncbi:hypothetical protein EV126DRAFT_444919 [Verticillium dahliae]|nr:hypothetical protein EV126DRAFT_444919 [Verticillium dahliae]
MSSHATALSSTKPEGQVAVARAKYTRRRVRGWETTKLFLRSLSLTVFLGIFITNMTYLLPLGATNSALDDIWPWMTMAAAGPALLWDVADLLTLWVRRGRAIAPKAQIGIELVLALGAGAGAGIVGWQLALTAAGFGPADGEAEGRAEGVLGALFTLMMLLLGARVVLFHEATNEGSWRSMKHPEGAKSQKEVPKDPSKHRRQTIKPRRARDIRMLRAFGASKVKSHTVHHLSPAITARPLVPKHHTSLANLTSTSTSTSTSPAEHREPLDNRQRLDDAQPAYGLLHLTLTATAECISITTPEDTRGGAFYTAVPHHRSTHRTAFVLRVTSIILSVMAISVICYSFTHDDVEPDVNAAFGAPTAIVALVWSSLDIVFRIVRDHGLWWRNADRDRRDRRFSFGHPCLHVTAHLAIWLGSAVLSVFLWQSYVYQRTPWPDWYSPDIYTLGYDTASSSRRTLTIAVLHALLPCVLPSPVSHVPCRRANSAMSRIVHFVLFVFACIAADDKKRHHVDVVFVPREDLREFEKVPPATLVEVVRSKRLPIAYYANHSVRYEPGADGTVQILRDYSSRQLS